ncbi:MAG: formylglycine-generating enzyme family protein [Candidatus Flexifilum sp.]
MSRYGSLNRRSGSAAWQWIVLGGVFGFGCAAIVVLAALAGGVITIGESVANLPTQTPVIITTIITATPPPASPTPIVTPTEMPPLEIQAPTATPTLAPTLLTPAPTVPPSPTAAPTVGGVGSALNTGGTGALPVNDRLLVLASELIPIAGGTFTMGTTIAEVAAAVEECLQGYGGEPGRCELAYGEDAQPQHQVTISPFLMERTEVSYEQYLAFLNGLGPGSHRNGCFGQPCMQTRNESETSNVTFDSANYQVLPVINNLPVTNVTWFGAQAYCQALGRRLPTEAEWEMAARGLNGRLYPWGDTWIEANASTSRSPLANPRTKAPVDAFPGGATPEGILNLAGNVEEWTADWYDPNFYSRPEASGLNPTGPAIGTERVVRGGAWDLVPFFARAVHRRSLAPLNPTASIGFRCVADAGSAQQATGGAQAAAGNSPIGAAPIQSVGTPDPASLGIIPGSGGSSEEQTANQINSAPTQPPRPTPLATTGP